MFVVYCVKGIVSKDIVFPGLKMLKIGFVLVVNLTKLQKTVMIKTGKLLYFVRNTK